MKSLKNIQKSSKLYGDFAYKGHIYRVIDDDGSFFIKYPELEGCFTQVEDDPHQAAREILDLWTETENERCCQ